METDTGIKQSVRFPNLSSLYDPDWPLKIPHFIPIKTTKEFEEKLGKLELKDSKWYEDGYLMIRNNPASSSLSLGMVILSIIVIYLWVRLSMMESLIIQAALK